MEMSSTRYRIALADELTTQQAPATQRSHRNDSQQSFTDVLECTELPEQYFGDMVAAPRSGVIGAKLETLLSRLVDQERDVDAMIHNAIEGERFGQRDLLRLQALVYSYTESVDIATKVVDRSIGGLRQLLTMQL